MVALSGEMAKAAVLSAIFVILSAISYFDIKTKKIPDFCVAALILCGGAVCRLWPDHGFLNHAAGFFAISVPMAVCASLRRGAFGGGDIKMMAAAGFLLGIPEIFRAFCTGILSAGGLAFYFLFFRGRKAKIALGPFLCLGILTQIVKLWNFVLT